MARLPIPGPAVVLGGVLLLGCGSAKSVGAGATTEGTADDPPVAEAPAPPPPTADPAPAPPVATPAPPPAPPPVAAKAGRAPHAGKHAAPALPPPGTPLASAPGFVRLEDGKSRIWVEVSSKVDVVESRTEGRVSYRLRGAAFVDPNDQLVLPTEFFTTPVKEVHLVPEGSDLDLILDMREDLAPTYRVIETPRGIVLQIDLPKSTIAPPVETAPPGAYDAPPRRAQTPQAPGSASPQQPGHGGGRHGRGKQTPQTPPPSDN
jgi:hypothetical protein